MKKELKARLEECIKILINEMETEQYTIDSTMLVAICCRGKCQLQLKITQDEGDFMDTGHGEVEI